MRVDFFTNSNKGWNLNLKPSNCPHTLRDIHLVNVSGFLLWMLDMKYSEPHKYWTHILRTSKNSHDINYLFALRKLSSTFWTPLKLHVGVAGKFMEDWTHDVKTLNSLSRLKTKPWSFQTVFNRTRYSAEGQVVSLSLRKHFMRPFHFISFRQVSRKSFFP